MKKIRVWISPVGSVEAERKLKDIAQKHALETTGQPEELEMVLTIQAGRLGFTQKGGFHFVACDFSKLRPLSAGQPMAKALGRNKKLKVLDCTAGWGMDSVLMEQLGFEVLAFEQNPLLFEVLTEETQHNTSLRLEFRLGDSFEYLQTLKSLTDEDKTQVFWPDIIYIDPMFEAKAKSAKSEKSIQVLQNLVEASPLTEEKLMLAMECARSHVVVKQNKRAAAFNIRPSARFEGQSTRFDVYRGKV